jgi:hydrogenase maturation protein HypF
MIRQRLNTPPVSSCGRLFDAVSFLAGLAPLQVEYEAEAPMRLEAAADLGCGESYPFTLAREEKQRERPLQPPYVISFAETIRGIVADVCRNVPAGLISARFHNTLAEVIAAAALRAREELALDTVVLSGGVFLNRTLLEKAESRLEELGFRVLRPVLYSPNDESISVGQIAFALNHLRSRT